MLEDSVNVVVVGEEEGTGVGGNAGAVASSFLIEFFLGAGGSVVELEAVADGLAGVTRGDVLYILLLIFGCKDGNCLVGRCGDGIAMTVLTIVVSLPLLLSVVQALITSPCLGGGAGEGGWEEEEGGPLG